jgi:hypothetical protein
MFIFFKSLIGIRVIDLIGHLTSFYLFNRYSEASVTASKLAATLIDLFATNHVNQGFPLIWRQSAAVLASVLM